MTACDEGGFTVEYRVFDGMGEGRWIIEVHTDLITLEPSSDLKPVAPLVSHFDTVGGLKQDVERMLTAFEKPVMTVDDFPNRGCCEECGVLKYRCKCW